MKARYFIQLVMLSALWGASFILTRVSAPQLGPNVSAGLRMLLATIVLGTIMRALKHPWPLRHWRELLLIGFLAVAGPHLLYSWSALHLPGGYGALLSVTAVLFGAFASALLKEETLTRGKLVKREADAMREAVVKAWSNASQASVNMGDSQSLIAAIRFTTEVRVLPLVCGPVGCLPSPHSCASHAAVVHLPLLPPPIRPSASIRVTRRGSEASCSIVARSHTRALATTMKH